MCMFLFICAVRTLEINKVSCPFSAFLCETWPLVDLSAKLFSPDSLIVFIGRHVLYSLD